MHASQNYNALSYDDKVLDGFYDLYGIMTESTTDKMPSLVDLQGTPVSDGVTWEAVLVNRAADANLLKFEQKALEMAVKSSNLSRAWRSLSYSLKATLGSMVLPLGSLTIGLPRHRALMFKVLQFSFFLVLVLDTLSLEAKLHPVKGIDTTETLEVLADCVGIPCRLVKGHLYTGSDDVAMNFVKLDDGREYIVDLTADPGTLIPSDAAGSHIEYDETFFSSSPLSRDVDSSHIASSSNGHTSSFEEHSELGTLEKQSRLRNIAAVGNQSDGRSESHEGANLTRLSKSGEESTMSSDDFGKTSNAEKVPVRELPGRPVYPYAHSRSPSWTEGVSSPAARRMKVKDVSQYMIDAAKENPQLAQKLHDVLLESGVVAPPNLFTEIYAEQLDVSTAEAKSPTEDNKVDNKALSRAALVSVSPSLPTNSLASSPQPAFPLPMPQTPDPSTTPTSLPSQAWQHPWTPP
ncbi:SERINE/THREONINE-PROTEIN KINASE TNNI3K-RELATED [Salix viminalis]|uniref:SERINE/THREONINE-PROTEIN KINASE TNNI3K-RELATED n=1 Tax=Salix viminalis TaxID=40686 RepID=A0A9Q0SHK1_SALVM|nr:SERINE/THREONINE-PROTEIN KINASE TNNI3K-RELATED [Salix viminalis]